ncbi:MAG: VCBS repeat-containing protein [Ignavibacteria bacterium]|nr:VCBS repeat-containing protein [Ignavibacteria bacterium]
MGLAVGSAAWGDNDNDGDLDILSNGHDGLNVNSIVYRNDSGSFVNINAGLSPAGYGSAVAWGDYDNDGDLDILLSGRIDNTNRITKI